MPRFDSRRGRLKSNGITISDLNNALTQAQMVPKGKESRRYWAIRQQIEWERRQKIMKGMARARAEGKRVGRPPVTALGETIYMMRQGGASWQRIAEHYHRPISTVFRRLDMYLREKGLPGASRNRVK